MDRLCIAAAASGIAALGIAVAAAAATNPEAEIASLTGTGEFRAFQEPDWKAARVKQPLFADNYVRTLALSRMALVYADGTQEQLAPNTMIRITASMAGKPATSQLQKGRVWMQSKNPPNGLIMQTPWAAAAIRGTDWEMAVDDDGAATLAVFSGEVELYNEHGRVLVQAGEQAHVSRGEAPVKLRLQVSRERIQWVSSFTVDPRRYAEFRDGPSDPALSAIANAVRDGRLGEAFDRVHARAEGAESRAIDLLLLADFRLYEGDLDAAQAALERGLRRFPADERFDVGLARVAILHDDFALAARHAEAALAKRPASVDALLMRGEIARREGRAGEAVAAYGRAAGIAARDPRAWVGLGVVETERENVRRARSHLERALELDGSDAEARAELGTLEGFAGNLPRGRAELEKALEIQPDNYVAWTGLGVLRLKAGDEEGAVQALVRASVIEPRYARAHLYLAAAYYQQGRDRAALFELARAAETDPNDPLPHLLASIIRLDRIEPGDAIAEAQQALARIPFLKSLNQVADNQKGVANVGAPLAFMGLEEWARSAAWDSYLPLWGGSHLFLADRYAGAFDRRSELMQGFIADPLAFGGSNRFQSLIVEPGHYGTASLRYAHSDDVHLTEPVLTLNGYGVSPIPTAYYVEGIDTRIEPGASAISATGRTLTVAAGAKPLYDLGTFIYANRLSIGADLGTRGVTGDFQRIDGVISRVDAGLRYAPDARSATWVKAGAQRQDSTLDELVRVILPQGSAIQGSHLHIKPTASDAALRQTFTPTDRLELTWGAEGSRQRSPVDFVRDADFHFEGSTVAPDAVDFTDRDRSSAVYGFVRAGGPAFQWELGGGWRDYRKDRDIAVSRGESGGGAVQVTETYRRRGGDPLAGVTWRFAPSMAVRAACRRWVRPIALDTLGPVAVAGMPLDDQLVLPGGVLEQCRAQWEWSDSRATYASARVERTRVRNLVSPLDGVLNAQSDVTNLDRLRNRVLAQPPKPDVLEDVPVYGEGVARRAGVALERLLAPGIAARAYYTYTESENTDPAMRGLLIPYLPRHQATVGASWAPGHHAFVTAQAVYRSRRFADALNAQPLAPGWDAQLDAFIETADKRWSVEGFAGNLLKKDVSDVFGIVVSYRF
jgi:tetratricopeptide (TPR) repeat protein